MSRRHAPASTSVFRVRILGGFFAPPGGPSIWREIELADNQSLTELGQAIPPAFGFEDDHLWSFFLSGKPSDRASEYARRPDPPVDLCCQATSVLPLLLPTLPITNAIGSSFPGGLDKAMVHLLSLLDSSAEPVTARELAGHFWKGHVEPLLDEQAAGRPELWRLTTGVETVQLLSLLQGLGMVEMGGGSDAEPAGIAVDPKPGSPARRTCPRLPRCGRGSPRSVPGWPTCCSVRPAQSRPGNSPRPTPPR